MAHIDTAEMYGDAELVKADAIAGGKRDDLYLVSKVLPSNASRRGTIAACERSLKRLKTDHLDCYLLHWRGFYPLEDTVAAFDQLIAEGKVRSWGAAISMPKISTNCWRSREPIDCALGKVRISGPAEFEDANIVTGTITVQAQECPDDVAAWHTEADRLAEHVRDIMSLASASVLRVPLVAFYEGDTLTVTAWSQSRASSSAFPIFHFLDLDPIFKTAVSSFFDPPIAVNRLSFAIEWFSMDATYNEVRLVAAMTALENLIDSNVTETEGLILPKKVFDKTRKVLLNVIRACVAKWSTGSEEALSEVNETLAGLNRRSMLRKLKLLEQRWNVPLDGISDESMRAAKNARDRVVHRGQYYEDAAESDADLWAHVTVIREIAVRFLLTAIGFKGRYYSYIGGYHDAVLPPAILPQGPAG